MRDVATPIDPSYLFADPAAPPALDLIREEERERGRKIMALGE
jgi:hypothetical protein